MKKLFLIAVIALVSGCADMDLSSLMGGSSADSSVRGRMQTCMLSEAQSRLQSGTLFANSITATAQDLASTCAKKLALESMGISQQSQNDAVNIINNLRSLSNN